MTASGTAVERFRAVVAQLLGLRFEDSYSAELEEVLQERMRAHNSRDPDSYLRRLQSERELAQVAARLTVPETYFFRMPEHFRALREEIVPARLRLQAMQEGAGNGDRALIRILSAGCASGEEPYSIAMVLHDDALLSNYQVEIHAVDVNEEMIARAQQARYSEWALRATPAEMRERYFRQKGNWFHLADAVRRRVRFAAGNLVSRSCPAWETGGYDVIFFRNVLMYFAPEAAQQVIANIRDALAPGGYLLLAPVENLRGYSSDFHLRHAQDVFYYQKRGTAQSAAWTAEKLPEPVLPQIVPEAATGTAGHDNGSGGGEPMKEVGSAPSVLKAPLATSGSGTSESHPARIPAAKLAGIFELLKQERYRDALELVRGYPRQRQADGDQDVQLLYAVLLLNNGEIDAAEDACRALLQTDELRAGAHYVMALCREHRGDHEGAAEALETVIYLDTAFAMAHLHLGLLARRRGALETARRKLQQASVLLAREDASRILLFGGGFSREGLIEICRRELRSCGGAA